jgi:hypothetical protein
MLDNKYDAIRGVVGRRDCLNENIAEFERLARLKIVDIGQRPEFAMDGAMCFSRHMDGNTEFSLKNAGAANMIDVVVRDDQGVDVSDASAVRVHAMFGLFTRDARVEQ